VVFHSNEEGPKIIILNILKIVIYYLSPPLPVDFILHRQEGCPLLILLISFPTDEG